MYSEVRKEEELHSSKRLKALSIETFYHSLISNFPFQISSGQKMTEVTSCSHEAFLISPTTEVEGAWKLVKKLSLSYLILHITCSIAQFLCTFLYFLPFSPTYSLCH